MIAELRGHMSRSVGDDSVRRGCMGDPEGGPLPSGLHHKYEAAYADSFVRSRSIDKARWRKAEQRTEELIKRIQGTRSSEARRQDVADYVRYLIQKCFDCKVTTFGSVPLKTYLPTGDIDLTILSRDPNLKDSWAGAVQSVLEKADGKFRVENVQYINAEVKLIKCRVENIVVDISFNQFGGLSTLCFLEEVDRAIGRDHFFKRSIILVKAWCYYDCRILGAHSSLISTYALETLVLYIFQVFHNSLRGPLEVLLRFLEFFSKFNWQEYAVSVWGPLPLSSLPEMIAESPRKDGGKLLLSKEFLDGCFQAYGGPLTRPESSQPRAFVVKHLNIVDFLRDSNNLGRSVHQGSFKRIMSALDDSAKSLLMILLHTSKDIDEYFEDHGFFRATEKRLDEFEKKRPDAAANAAAQYARIGYEGLHYYHQNGSGIRQVVDNGDTIRSYMSETNNVDPNLRRNPELWISESDQRQQSSTPTQMGGSNNHAFHPSAASNGEMDSSQFLCDSSIPGRVTNSSSVPEASHSPGGYTGGKGRFSNGEAVLKPLGIIAKSSIDSADSISIEKLTKTSRQQGDARGSGGSSSQSGEDFASADHRSSYTQNNFDSNGVFVSSSESPLSGSSRGSVNFFSEAVSEGPVLAKRAISNHSTETEVSRRSCWAGEQPSYIATNVFLEGQEYAAQQRGQESVSRVSTGIPLPVSVIPHAQIPVTLPHQGQMPMHLATSMAVSQPMTFTGSSPPFGLHAGNVSTSSMIGESPIGTGSHVGSYYAIQLPRGPPVPPLPPGYFHVPPSLAQHHLSTTGEIPNAAAGRISTSFPVQQGEDQGFEQQQQQQQQQQAWQMQQLHSPGYLRPVSTMNAAALPPSPPLLNSENSTVISSACVGGFGPFHVPVSLPATQRSQIAHNSSSSINLESLTSTAVGHDVPQDVKPDNIGKSSPSHGEEVGNSTTTGGKSSPQVGSEAGARATKNSKSGKEKRAASKSKMTSNENGFDVGMLTSGAESSGHQPQTIADDTSVQIRQGHPQLVSVTGLPPVGPSVYTQFVSSSLPLQGTGLVAEISPYPPPPMVRAPKPTTVGYPSLPSQTSIQALSMPVGTPAEPVSGASSSLATKQRQRPTENVPLPPFYFPPGNAYPYLSMQRVYVVPPSPPDQAFIGLDSFSTMQFSKPFDSYSDLGAAGQGDDTRLRLSQQQVLGVGERLRAAGVATSSLSSSEATITDARAFGGEDSNFVGGDLLSSDLNNHVRNLDYARWCQNKQAPLPVPYGPQYMTPTPKHYQDYRGWEGPGRPLTANANMYSNMMNYGHGIVQGSPSMTTSMRSVGSFHRSFAGPGSYNSDDIPKSHGGTGSYIPNPRPPYLRDRHSSVNGRNQHPSYSQERGERVEREANQVNGPRLRARGPSKHEPRQQTNNAGVERSNADLKGGEKSRDRDIHRQYECQRRNPMQSASGTAFASPPSVGIAPLTVMSHSPAGPPVETYSVPNVTGNGKASTSGTVGGTASSVVAKPLEFGSVGQVQVGASQAGIEVDNGAGHISSSRIHEQVNAPPELAGLSLGSGGGSSQGPSSLKQSSNIALQEVLNSFDVQASQKAHRFSQIMFTRALGLWQPHL